LIKGADRATGIRLLADDEGSIIEMKVITVVSGGIDSVTLAYKLKADGHDLKMISFDYGQRHRKELDFAKRAASALQVHWRPINLAAAGVGEILSGSALIDREVAVPEGHYAADNMRLTIVPNRNAIMLAIAYGLAVSSSADAVAFAVHSGDHPVYPDCRPEFIASFEAMEHVATGQAIELLAPFVRSTKVDIVALGAKLGVPFQETWSCYLGEAVHCGACGTCHERREAFQLAGVPDPTEYARTPALPPA
jgi:7-cyano-7-deazaguanine synthase